MASLATVAASVTTAIAYYEGSPTAENAEAVAEAVLLLRQTLAYDCEAAYSTIMSHEHWAPGMRLSIYAGPF